MSDISITANILQRVLGPVAEAFGRAVGAHGKRLEVLEAKVAALTPRVDRDAQQQSATSSRLSTIERQIAELRKAAR